MRRIDDKPPVVQLIDFDKDHAAQELLGYAGISEAYEEVISRVSLDILRQSVPGCQIESIRYVRPAGRHPAMRAGGMPIEEGSSKIKLQEMTLPFDLEITVVSGDIRHRLTATFTFECRKMDTERKNEFRLAIHDQQSM